VATICEQGRINGVKKAGKTWLLPPDAVKPVDQRCKENRKKKDNNNMSNYTEYQSRFFAEQLTIKRPSNSIDSLAPALTGAKVDLNPHQIDAALFAFNSPLSQGVLLADEVGLGKTIEAGIAIAQYFAEHKRHILLIVPASLRNQWLSELDEKFYIKSIILEAKNFNSAVKQGIYNPFDKNDKVIICSYNFAAQKQKRSFKNKMGLSHY
ncbi:MAG: SNF2-related protein, partial [Oscillospiraceae bacterium]